MFGIDDAIAAGSKLIDDVITRIWPDATEVEKAKLSQMTQEIQNEYNLILSQIEVNKVEAAHPSIWVAGWRPYIGWIGGTAMAYNFFLKDVMNGMALALGSPVPLFIGSDTQVLVTLIMGMLGLAGTRSYDKANGTETKQFNKGK